MLILPQEYLLHYVHDDFFHNNQKLKTTSVHLYRRVHKETVEQYEKGVQWRRPGVYEADPRKEL